MKKIAYIMIAALMMLTSCHDDDNGFPTDVTASAFTFRAIAGGAVMHYNLKGDPDIVGINVRYKDAYGTNILRTGSMNCDTLSLPGFNEATQNVPATITLCNRAHEESQPIAVSFNTEESAPVAFLRTVEVNPGWNGFYLEYNAPANAQGIAHVLYLGRKSETAELDTLLLNTFALEEGDNTLNFVPTYSNKENTVVLRVEDFRGHMIGQKIFGNIPQLTPSVMKIAPEQFYCENSIEDETCKVGAKYLFDGDKNGVSWFDTKGNEDFYSFLAGPDGAGLNAVPMYLDLMRNHVLAELRMYTLRGLNANVGVGPNFYGANYRSIWNYDYSTKLPCNVTVYGCKDDHAGAGDWESKDWVELATFEQSEYLDRANAWCGSGLPYYSMDNKAQTREEAEALESKYLGVLFNVKGQDDGYRYLKVIVNKVFAPTYQNYGMNPRNYVTLSELEVWSN